MHRVLRALVGLVVAALLPLVLSSPTQATVIDGVDWGDLDPSGLEPMGGTPEADTPKSEPPPGSPIAGSAPSATRLRARQPS